MTFTSDDEDKVLQVEKPSDSTFETEDEVQNLFRLTFLNLGRTESLESGKRNARGALPLHSPRLRRSLPPQRHRPSRNSLQNENCSSWCHRQTGSFLREDNLLLQENEERVKQILNFLAKSKAVLPTISLVAENVRLVFPMKKIF